MDLKAYPSCCNKNLQAYPRYSDKDLKAYPNYFDRNRDSKADCSYFDKGFKDRP